MFLPFHQSLKHYRAFYLSSILLFYAAFLRAASSWRHAASPLTGFISRTSPSHPNGAAFHWHSENNEEASVAAQQDKQAEER